MRKVIIAFLLLFVTVVWADNPHNLPSTPVIVAQSLNSNQSSQVGPLTLASALADEDFRLSAYIEVPQQTFQSTPCMVVSWGDNNGLQSQKFSLGVPQWQQITFTMHVAAGNSVVVEVPNDPAGGCSIPLTYGVFFTLEKLD